MVEDPPTPPDYYQQHDSIFALLTDNSSQSTIPSRKPIKMENRRKKKKKAKLAARASSMSSHTTGEQNGISDSAHHAGSLSEALDVLPPSPEEPGPVLEESPQEKVEEKVEEIVIVEKTTVIDPDGDVILVLTCPEVEWVGSQEEAKPENQDGNESESEKPIIAEPCPRHVHHVLVSSSHLSLASPVFKEMLRTNNVAKSGAPDTAGKVVIDLPEDEGHAMLTILNIIHNQGLHIPRSTSLGELTQIAVLVDKYDMAMSTSFVVRTWIQGLKYATIASKKGKRARNFDISSLPTKFGHDLLRWLFVAWVFCVPEVFTELSEVAMMQSSGRIDEDNGLPELNFPEAVVDAIDSTRQSAVQELITAYSKTVDRFWDTESDETACVNHSQLCDSNVLGSLLRSGKRDHLYPIPSAPFRGLSFTDTMEALYNISFAPCPEEGNRGEKKVSGKKEPNFWEEPAAFEEPVVLNNTPCCHPGNEFFDTISCAETVASKFSGLEIGAFLASSRKDLIKMPGNER